MNVAKLDDDIQKSCYRLSKDQGLGSRKPFFCWKIINVWNRLPKKAIKSLTMKMNLSIWTVQINPSNISSVSGEITKNHMGSYFVKALFQQGKGWKRISIFILNQKLVFFQR